MHVTFKKGGVTVTFKQLFDDDAVANSLESLAGTLKAAKKKKFVDYGPELLLQVRQLQKGRTGKLYEDNPHFRVPVMMW